MNCEVLVVGAGALGLSSAYHIKRKNPGKRVTVIERERAAGLGNSLRNEGGFRNFFSSETNYQLSDSTIDWFTYLESVLNYDLKLENIGYLWLLSKDQWSQYKSVIKDITRRGILTRVIQRDELKNMIPQTVIDFSRDREAEKLGLESPEIGVLAEKAGSIDPQALIKSYEREFIKLGACARLNQM
jgi:glycine/D-amino acid oxidase-like deaminating enzyme